MSSTLFENSLYELVLQLKRRTANVRSCIFIVVLFDNGSVRLKKDCKYPALRALKYTPFITPVSITIVFVLSSIRECDWK